MSGALFIVLVCGGRDYSDSMFVFETLDALHRARPIYKVVQGGARGADALAYDWCRSRRVMCWHCPADWNNITRPGAVVRTRRDGKKYDAAAGGVRNQRMLDEGKPSLVLAFPGGKGTADMVSRARRAGVKVIETHPANPEPASGSERLGSDATG
ncbi:MAG: DUF2493 domain-containing protein [Caulobacter sp.]|nr:DUF2493 domain-containing protein [Caulobacter sp.]